MQILVTGASGFIGRHVVRELVEAGHAVTTLHRGDPLQLLGLPPRRHIQASVLDPAARDAAANAEAVVHLAGRGDVLASYREPSAYAELNAGGTLNVLDRARRGLPLTVHADQQRDLTWVGDVARGVRLSVESPPGPAQPARAYNLATGVGTTLHQLAQLVCAAVGSPSEIVPPAGRSEEGDRVADISRARTELRYAPTVAIQDGIARLAALADRGPST
jgi:nucleoside-diphosphate-sugar epimerase